MSKILITGGAGFIGHALGRRLAGQGHQVVLADNFARGARDAELLDLSAQANVRLLEVDLLAPDATGGFDTDFTHIIHLAARLGVDNVLKRPYQTLQDNVLLMAPVIELARRQSGLERLVFTSTSEVYAGSLEVLDMPIPTPEETPLANTPLDHPRTSYMLSKIYGEAMIRHCGLPFTIFRPHNVYGPRMGTAHVIPQLLEKAHNAKAGESIQVFSPDHTRTFCYIDDAVEMMIAAMFAAAGAGQVLNLGNERPETAIADLARLVVQAVGKDLTLTWGETTPGSPSRRCPAMGRMKQVTGLEGQVGLADGIQRTYDWYRAHVFGPAS